jgi:hypothetical protein
MKDDCRRQQVPQGIRRKRLPRSIQILNKNFGALCLAEGFFHETEVAQDALLCT